MGGCLGGCEAGGPMWVWFDENNNFDANAGWEERDDSNFLLRVHVRHQ